jgi:low affinity Fe/Cu permease
VCPGGNRNASEQLVLAPAQIGRASGGMLMSNYFMHFANVVAKTCGRPMTFAVAVLIILAWAFCGPYFAYSDTWQLVINTGTTIITFLMVFLIQNTQNRDAAAIQTKLDELIRASAAQNRYIGIEDLTEEELEKLRDTCKERADKLVTARDTANEVTEAVRRKATHAARRAAG